MDLRLKCPRSVRKYGKYVDYPFERLRNRRKFAYLICAAHERQRSTLPSATGSHLSPPSMFIYVFWS